MGAELVKKEFELFLKTHVPDACLDNVDDIVLDYVAEVLGDLGAEESFDVDQFSEMVSAYVPEFSAIDCSVVCEWVFELAEKQKSDAKSCSPKPSPEQQTVKVEPKSSERERSCTPLPPLATSTSCDEDTALLREMFPDVSEDELSAVLVRCARNMEEAIQQLLALPEQEREREAEVKHRELVQSDPSKTDVCGDKDIKESVLARYAFVDTDEDKVTHRPVLTKAEPKKMVRYREGQVVSTKGERFTVLTRKDTEGEEMKKTYVNLNPLRKYRFH